MKAAPRTKKQISPLQFDKITTARSKLMIDQPFFGTLIMKLRLQETDTVQTAATDGRRILYNDTYLAKITNNQTIGLFAHEVLHCVFLHMYRRGDRDPRLWNVSADLAINGIILDEGMELPEGALYEERFKGMSVEDIYDIIKEEGNTNAPLDWVFEDGTPAEQAEAEEDWAIDVQIAAENAKDAGKMPAALENFIDKFNKPKINWRAALRRFFTAYGQNDYSWARPKKRFLSQGIYLPSLHSDEIEDVVLAIDTSGSVSDTELECFGGEINSILHNFRCDITVIYCDAEVQDVQQFNSSELPHNFGHEFPGRGGTRLQPVFDYINEKRLTPSCMVYFTDGGIWDTPKRPNYPFLVITTGTEIDIGDNIHYDPNT